MGRSLSVQPPEPSKGHFYVSLVKSFVRIGAGVAFILSAVTPMQSELFLIAAGSLLVVAEVLGIVEEIV